MTAVERAGSGFRVRTDRGEWRARNVVVATGDCAVPAVPWFASSAPAPVEQLHASRYRAPASLAPGGVLVVGAGPSGHQIADELARAGRRVVLAVGPPRAHRPSLPRPRHLGLARRARGAVPVVGRPAARARSRPRPALPLDGRQGGRTIDLGVLAEAGVRIAGRLEGFAGSHALLGSGSEASIADADARLRRLLGRIDDHIDSRARRARVCAREHVAPIQPPSPAAHDRPRGRGHLDDRLGDGLPPPLTHGCGSPRSSAATAASATIGGVRRSPDSSCWGCAGSTRMTSHQIGGVGADAAFLAEQIAPRRTAAGRSAPRPDAPRRCRPLRGSGDGAVRAGRQAVEQRARGGDPGRGLLVRQLVEDGGHERPGLRGTAGSRAQLGQLPRRVHGRRPACR